MRWLGIAVAALLLEGCGAGAPRLGTGQPSLNTAQAALESGAPELALTICQRMVERSGTDVGALTCQGDALAALGRPAEADAAFTAALAHSPRDVGALLGLGRLRLADDPRRAEALFRQALQQDPRRAAAANDLGVALDLQGRHAEAQTAYGQALGVNPDMRAAQVNMALSVALAGRPGDASRLLLPLVDRPEATVRERHNLAAILAMEGRVTEATRLLNPDLQGAQLDAAIAGYRALVAR